jgi:radical SAM protein with 4Fe4S-binding SPASM domain
MSPEDFAIVVRKIRPFTDYVYLHVLGEPLLHPRFEEILSIARKADLNINLTTNGSLIAKQKPVLLANKIRQINFSLHDAEENIKPEHWADYLQSILNFADEASGSTYINFRLWNSGMNVSENFTQFFLPYILNWYDKNNEKFSTVGNKNGIKLAEHIFLQSAPRFVWPKGSSVNVPIDKTCYALRDHIAILANGQVVPCCLDADAQLYLGNIFTENPEDILQTLRAVSIRKGFEQHRAVEPFCATCGFSTHL